MREDIILGGHCEDGWDLEGVKDKMCLDVGGHGDDVHKNLVEGRHAASSCHPKLIQSLPGGVQGRALKEHVGQITLHR